ncbi:MAG: helix-turn-helix transcriptional regulator [Emcibacteraceae bacterium]|nr:helix-turn-helix transcriptional regulator [Emcibacteraceae bacterium]
MQQLDNTFTALSDVTRRAIVARLADGEQSLSKLAEPFEMSQTAVSKHVRVLSDAGLVIVEKRGRIRHCKLDAAPMKEAIDWLKYYEAFWADKFASLTKHLAKD